VGVGIGGGEIVEKGLEVRQLHGELGLKEPLTSARGDGPIDIEILVAMLVGSDWFDAGQGEAPTSDSLQAEATLVHRPHFHRLLSHPCRPDQRLQLLSKRVAKSCHCVRVFLYDCGAAPSVWRRACSAPAYGPCRTSSRRQARARSNRAPPDRRQGRLDRPAPRAAALPVQRSASASCLVGSVPPAVPPDPAARRAKATRPPYC